MKTTTEEIAEIIFNSESFKLNDIILEAQKSDYPINLLIKTLTTDINDTSSHILNELTIGTQERTQFIEERITYELALVSKLFKARV